MRLRRPPTPRVFFDTYCITCHNQKLKTAGLMLDKLDLTNPGAHAETLEKVIAKLRAGSMPPPGMPRANDATYHVVASTLENEVDKAWAAHPNPGRIGAVHRLNRVGIQQRDSRPVRAGYGREAAASGR